MTQPVFDPDPARKTAPDPDPDQAAPNPSGPVPPEPASTPPLPPVLTILLIVIIGIEAVLTAADAGLTGSARWRALAYQYGAFWPGLLDDWAPNFAGQSAWMFATYAFLHGGLAHLLGNALTLWSLGAAVCARTGQWGFVLAYGLSAFGGALCFAALSPGPTPMVGASGALFGLAGLWVGWQWRDRSPGLGPALAVLGLVAGLVALNLILFVWYDGGLAWETHLGGFVVGLALSIWVGHTRRSGPFQG